MPQTYIRAVGPGVVGCTERVVVSYTCSCRPTPGSPWSGRLATPGVGQDRILGSLSVLRRLVYGTSAGAVTVYQARRSPGSAQKSKRPSARVSATRLMEVVPQIRPS